MGRTFMYMIVLLYDPITDIIMPSTIMLSLYKQKMQGI